MQNDPDALVWGHTLRYWVSRPSPAKDLAASKAKLLIVYGTDDKSSPVVTSDLLVSELTELGRKFELRRIPGADHSYTIKGVRQFQEVLSDSINWALKD